jgi:hypothetical protein
MSQANGVIQKLGLGSNSRHHPRWIPGCATKAAGLFLDAFAPHARAGKAAGLPRPRLFGGEDKGGRSGLRLEGFHAI